MSTHLHLAFRLRRLTLLGCINQSPLPSAFLFDFQGESQETDRELGEREALVLIPPVLLLGHGLVVIAFLTEGGGHHCGGPLL